jgi:hypothetical protein
LFSHNTFALHDITTAREMQTNSLFVRNPQCQCRLIILRLNFGFARRWALLFSTARAGARRMKSGFRPDRIVATALPAGAGFDLFAGAWSQLPVSLDKARRPGARTILSGPPNEHRAKSGWERKSSCSNGRTRFRFWRTTLKAIGRGQKVMALLASFLHWVMLHPLVYETFEIFPGVAPGQRARLVRRLGRESAGHEHLHR